MRIIRNHRCIRTSSEEVTSADQKECSEMSCKDRIVAYLLEM